MFHVSPNKLAVLALLLKQLDQFYHFGSVIETSNINLNKCPTSIYSTLIIAPIVLRNADLPAVI